MLALKHIKFFVRPLKTTFRFSSFLNKTEKKWVKPEMPAEINNDDLYFPHHLEEYNGGVEKVKTQREGKTLKS
jgi:hypothetical protein